MQRCSTGLSEALNPDDGRRGHRTASLSSPSLATLYAVSLLAALAVIALQAKQLHEQAEIISNLEAHAGTLQGLAVPEANSLHSSPPEVNSSHSAPEPNRSRNTTRVNSSHEAQEAAREANSSGSAPEAKANSSGSSSEAANAHSASEANTSRSAPRANSPHGAAEANSSRTAPEANSSRSAAEANSSRAAPEANSSRSAPEANGSRRAPGKDGSHNATGVNSSGNAEGPRVPTSSARTVCEKHTGGTCFFSKCLAQRNAVCVHSWERLQWHSCACGEGLCVGPDGICHNHSFPFTTESWFRQESYSTVFMIVVMIGRSGLDGFVFGVTGLDRLTAAHRKITTRGLSRGAAGGLRPFDDLAREQELNRFQVAVICSVKFVFWHFAQPLFFWSAWFAYVGLMDRWQFSFATCVALKEAWYTLVLLRAARRAPHFLLYVPFSAQTAKWLYFLSPAGFTSAVLSKTSRDLDVNVVLAFLTACVEFSGAICSWAAMGIGFWGRGVMFPALFLCYIISGLSFLGGLHWLTLENEAL